MKRIKKDLLPGVLREHYHGRVEYLAAFLKQDKRTCEVTFDFEKIRHI